MTRTALTTASDGALEAKTEQPVTTTTAWPLMPGWHFSYTRAELTLGEGEAKLEAQRHETAGQRLVSERVEAHIDPTTCLAMMTQMTQFMEQSMKLFLAWLPRR